MYKWLIGIGAVLLSIVAVFNLATVRLKQRLRERMIASIKEQYKSDVELKAFDISLFPRFTAVGEGLTLRQKERPGLPPLITVNRLTVNATLSGVLREQSRVERLTLEGLQINVPPKQHDSDKAEATKSEPPRFVVNEVIADGAVLQILPKKEGKEPLIFNLAELTLHSAGTTELMDFRATLTNPKPPGIIQSTGKFGPWNKNEPGLTPINGSYTFQNADLSVFKGIAGILSSEGKYQGVLGRVEVDGATDTPDFTLKIGGHPVHLKTQFHAVVDGADCDTSLDPLNAQFGGSTLVARGGVYGKPGVKGKTVSLDVIVSDSRIEDILRLALKGEKPLMTGAIAFKTKFELAPGDRDVIDKLNLNGGFGVGAARFTSLKLQEKVDKLSHRARGQVGDEVIDERVVSNLRGSFVLNNSAIRFSNLTFNVPGAAIHLQGSYSLRGEDLDFDGTLRTQAKVSQMTTGVKSFFLKLVDPIFKKKGNGAVVPIKIRGTQEKPKFGLDTDRVFSGKKKK